MQMPNAAGAYVDAEKITSYLLSLSHKDGGDKARSSFATAIASTVRKTLPMT